MTVLFTTVPETVAALRKAAVMAGELNAGIRILVPYLVPYALPLECPPTDPKFRVRELLTFCEQESFETRIEIKLCRDVREFLLRELAPRSIVVIGAEYRWPFNKSLRIARSLQRSGHHVLFVRRLSKSEADLFDASYLRTATIHSRLRLRLIVSFLVVYSCCAIVTLTRHQYPLSVAGVLFLIPALLRELDLKNGRPSRGLGSLEWSCLLAGTLFLFVLPFIIC